MDEKKTLVQETYVIVSEGLRSQEGWMVKSVEYVSLNF